jgi:hemerythrin
MPHRKIDPILWRDDYAIGVSDIDLQHQRLLFLLNKLNSLVNNGKITRKRVVIELLDDFNEYATHHFSIEESLMTLNLPEDDAVRKHLVAHQSYWIKIPQLTVRYREGDTAAALELLEYLNQWWINHILGTDQALGRELNRVGVH